MSERNNDEILMETLGKCCYYVRKGHNFVPHVLSTIKEPFLKKKKKIKKRWVFFPLAGEDYYGVGILFI